MNDLLKNKLKLIPHKPGCYLWKDQFNQIIYIGKAKDLYNRTHSYFNGCKDNKTSKLVNNINDLEYIVVNNVNEALILENNLIKTHLPKYNILLKDGSNYPYIMITNEQYPRLKYVRTYDKNKGIYFGPLADSTNKYQLFNLLNSIFPFNKCNHQPYKKCIYYDLHQCINQVQQSTYQEAISEVKEIFKGNLDHILMILQTKEQHAVTKLDFENAQKYAEQQKALTSIINSGLVQLDNNESFDIIGFYEKNNYLVIIIFNYVKGKLLNKSADTFAIYDYEINELITSFLMQYYSQNKISSKIIVSLDDDNLLALSQRFHTKFINAQTKFHKRILKLALDNAILYFESNIKNVINKQNELDDALNQLKQILKLPDLNIIECFDNSNINLSLPIAGMIVYQNGKLNNKLNRKYNLMTTKNASDYHFMIEVITRRYQRLVSQHQKLPNLIVVDGGKLQVNAALYALAQLQINIPLIGLKKDQKHKTDAIVLTNGDEIVLDRKSILYKFLANMQNDVHNYAISFLRDKHTKSIFNSLLDNVQGLGKKRFNELLKYYDSINDLKSASDQELLQFLPKNVLVNLREKLNKI
ncbi:excinuclease ABC subunit UvrC [Ureaplasma parvum]|uniref:UvrABC system protein C n=4 Tax=Ureaplasma parvum TaxID=134821 RepID=UVRC_UREPA|nr:excinuclease ABC subunit UvrC [Ureaplasma parvum]B1AJ20.1 RecName: Full=UvrABC system protein C; Short=Protein UvrC; AltName: Full=Excinuclease ABC subunit C [Ureaplasma parvum serovar 3 str. ATCC 27815]Q9PQA9.1 RecName: Full=UvrABC system protein C; Short=Protein UvrC; AltName: Full=Excinuclease ABC subunit C [Ureaplasma parvum serovar 3 str. ATCC 700970]pir/H82898/ excinuclease ABC subunit c UU381 [imported] - Ureaplasma urealyticum [Ureaplasma urealyticum]AAF30791.1 excinuclease ABC subun